VEGLLGVGDVAREGSREVGREFGLEFGLAQIGIGDDGGADRLAVRFGWTDPRTVDG
jgi:hypothetical protein